MAAKNQEQGVRFHRTSKFVSASPKTSSRSGGSARTADTERTLIEEQAVGGKYAATLKKMNRMSLTEFRQMLLGLGIIKRDGKLTAKYASQK